MIKKFCRILIFSLCLLLSFCACKKQYKNPDTIVSGKVVDAITLQPIDGARISLSSTKCLREDFFGSCKKEIQQFDIVVVYTNVNGDFELKFCKIDASYFLPVSKEGYKFKAVPLVPERFANNDTIKLYK